MKVEKDMKEEQTTQANIGPKVPKGIITLLPHHSTLIGNHCTIETLDLDKHVHQLLPGIKHEQLWVYSIPDMPNNEEEFTHFFEERRANNHFYVVKRKGDNTYVGFMALMEPSVAHKSIQIGYFRYSPDVQRTTLTTEVFYLMARYVFEELKYNRLEWMCDKTNSKSNDAAVRFGFLFQGCFREDYISKGIKRDKMIYSILLEEWPKLKSGFEAWLQESNFSQDGKEKEKLRLREIRAQLNSSS